MRTKEAKEALNGYFRDCFLYDLKAGFITAIVALPLAIAFAVASGAAPIMGLYTSVIAGSLASFFGGSRYSITGPTGAMTVVILSTINRYGLEGLLLAGFLAGLIQVILGAVKLGKLIKYLPQPIISGFTAGIGIIIFIGQVPNALGLDVTAKEHVWETISAILEQAGNINPNALAVATGTIFILWAAPKAFSKTRYLKSIPASIMALVFFSILTYSLGVDIPQIGEIPTGFPGINPVNFDLDLLKAVLPAAMTIALLGVIESLLCAVVCDGMTNTRHDSDRELLAQGLCNIVSPFFNGLPATAAIARSAVNIREGAKTRISGVIHAAFILLTVLLLGPLVAYVPQAFLAGILMTVSYKMVDLEEIKTIMNISRAELTVLGITIFLTVATDLVFAVQMGMVLSIGLIFIKLSNMIDVSTMAEYDIDAGINKKIYSDPMLRDRVSVYTIHGPLFFGAMNVFDRKVGEHIDNKRPEIILRMKNVPFIDATAITRLNSFINSRHKQGYSVYLSGLTPKVREALGRDSEFTENMKENHLFEKTEDAIEYIKKRGRD